MYIDPIHAGTVALAQALAPASRVDSRSGASVPAGASDTTARRSRFRPLRDLAQWWRDLEEADSAAADPAQLMLWAECGGRAYATALGGLLLMEQLRQKRTAARHGHQ